MVEDEHVTLKLHDGFGLYYNARSLRIELRRVALLSLDQTLEKDRGGFGSRTSVDPRSPITVEQGTVSALCEE